MRKKNIIKATSTFILIMLWDVKVIITHTRVAVSYYRFDLLDGFRCRRDKALWWDRPGPPW